MLNIFSRSPEATPVVIPTPVVAEKTSFTEKVRSFFSSYKPCILDAKHQDNIRQMMKRLPSVNSTLAYSVFENIKNEDVQQILHYHHDLNNLTIDQAKASPTYTKFYALLSKTVIARLIRLGSGINPSKKGGIADAELALKNQLLIGMKEGVANALQGKGLTDLDKQSFLENSVASIQAKLNDGSATPSEVLEEVRKLTADSVFGADAQEGTIGKQLGQITAQAEQQIRDTEKATVIEAIDGNYQVQNEKMDLINSLLEKLASLQNGNDSSVEDSVAVNQEIQSVTNQILELVKELDESSTISPAHIKNPLSRNIKGSTETELKTLLAHDLNKAELFLKTKAEEINGELIAKLKTIQDGRSMSQKMWDGTFNRSSKENAILAKSAKTQQRIQMLNKSITSFEAAQAAKAAAASARTWSQFGADLLTRVNPFKGSPSARDQQDIARANLEAFEADETVQTVFQGYERLVMALDHVENKKFFLLPSSKKAAVEKAAGELGDYVTANLGTFETRQELVKVKNAAEIAVAELDQAEEEAEEVVLA